MAKQKYIIESVSDYVYRNTMEPLFMDGKEISPAKEVVKEYPKGMRIEFGTKKYMTWFMQAHKGRFSQI